MESCIDIPLDEEVLKDIVEKAKDYCLMHGECNTEYRLKLEKNSAKSKWFLIKNLIF